MVAPVFLKNKLHDVVFEVVSKINVDVGQFMKRHPLFVKKAPEIKVESNRANPADSQAIADQAVGSAAARDPLDAACAAVLKKVPGDKKYSS